MKNSNVFFAKKCNELISMRKFDEIWDNCCCCARIRYVVYVRNIDLSTAYVASSVFLSPVSADISVRPPRTGC